MAPILRRLFLLVGLGGLEPPTPRLSSVCSNQLSYRPLYRLFPLFYLLKQLFFLKTSRVIYVRVYPSVRSITSTTSRLLGR